MPDIDLTKTDIPFLLDGSGSLHVQANVADLDQPLAPGDEDFFNLGFNAAGGHSFAIGAQDSVKLGIEAKTSARLIPLWASSSMERLKLLENYGLSGYFDPAQNHAGRLLLLLALGAEMDASVSGKYSYSVLSMDATLKAGADAGYALVRSYPAGTIARELIADFFRGLRLPANVSAPLAADEVIVFEYGGYLQFNASLGVGYELSGAPSFEISQLAFSEKYAFSLIGKVSFGASVAGRFKVEVRGGAEQGWARIAVRKSHASSFSVAADVTASATFEQKGLPETPNEFLSALIGLNSKNWLNLFDQIHDLTDFNKLQAYLDNLATQSAIRQLNEEIRRGSSGDVVYGLQMRLVKLGYLTLAQVTSGQKHFGPQTEAALKTFQSQHGVAPSGILTDETYRALLASAPTPPPLVPVADSTRIDTVLPESGKGFTTYKREQGGADQYGRASTIRSIMDIAESWCEQHPDLRLQFGDISRRGGGSFDPPHKAHQRGLEVDIRPITNNGREEPTSIHVMNYSHELTKELAQLIKEKFPAATIFFNDQRLIGLKLTSPLSGHDDHLHLRFPA